MTISNTWRSITEIERILTGKADVLSSVVKAFSLSVIARNGYYSSEYKPSTKWSQIVTLTSEGRAYLDIASDATDNFAPEEIHFVLFLTLYHSELLIDVEHTDLQSVHNVLNDETLNGSIKWPYRYGRLLYDKFNDQFDHGVDQLKPEQSAYLLRDTPQGIYQVGSLVSGPLGLLTSAENRYEPPGRPLCLWHCPDTGCRHPHDVRLLDNPRFKDLRIALNRSATSHFGPVSPWYKVLRRCLFGSFEAPSHHPSNMLFLVGNCLVESEVRCLLKAAFAGGSNASLRQVLERSGKNVKAPSDALVNKLDQAEVIHLLLTLKDDDLIRLIDEAVEDGKIRIPSTEIRHSHENPARETPNSVAVISTLGVRCESANENVLLAVRLMRLYSKHGLANDLEWRLEGFASDNSIGSVMNYLRQKGPEFAVRNLVVLNKPIAEEMAKEIHLTLKEGQDSDTLTQRFLWKLGFTLPRYEDTYQRLRRRLEGFNRTLLEIGNIQNEGQREEIRSSGVNLFVSIEDFLDQMISYVTWILASDHFVDTKFVFSLNSARQSVRRVLGDSITAGNVQFYWKTDGDNSLGALLQYLTVCGRWALSLCVDDREKFNRLNAELPFYAESGDVVFPFRHTALWADASSRQLAEFANDFANISKKLQESNLAMVRNGLDHNRESSDFPSLDSMLVMVAKFRDAFEAADVKRYIPKTFWLDTALSNRSGQTKFVFLDYLNQRVEIHGPRTVTSLPRIEFREPILLPPADLLGYVGADLQFRKEEHSVWREYWVGYPRRHASDESNRESTINPDDTQIVVVTNEDAKSAAVFTSADVAETKVSE